MVAHGDDAPIPHEFDDKLRAALPLWKDLKVIGKLSDVALKAPFGQAKVKSVGETIGLSGLTAPATGEFGFQIESDDRLVAGAGLGRGAHAGRARLRLEVPPAADSIRRLRSPWTILPSPPAAICRQKRKTRSTPRCLAATPS